MLLLFFCLRDPLTNDTCLVWFLSRRALADQSLSFSALRLRADGMVPHFPGPRPDDAVDDGHQRTDLQPVPQELHAAGGQLLEPRVRRPSHLCLVFFCVCASRRRVYIYALVVCYGDRQDDFDPACSLIEAVVKSIDFCSITVPVASPRNPFYPNGNKQKNDDEGTTALICAF